MNYKTTLIIIVLLICIAGTYFLFFNQPTENRTSDKKLTISETYDLPRKGIVEVKISYSDDAYQSITFAKNDDGIWYITTPFNAHADLEKVNEVLDDFLNKRVRQTLDVSEYQQYGLENPTIKVQLWKDRSGSPKTFLIGKKGINFSVYVKEETEKHIFLIESSALDDLSISTTDIRDRSVIKFNPESITEITYQKPEQFTCVKIGDAWKMTHPLSVDADSDDISYILSELHTIQVSTFELDGENVNASLKKYGLEIPRIQLTLKDGETSYGLAIGAEVQTTTDQQNTEKDTVYVKSIHQGGIYTVTDDITKLLNKTAFDLRDKRLIDFQRGDVVKFEIQRGTENITSIRLQKDLWEIQGKNKVIANPQAVSDLIYGVDSMEATAYVSNATNNLALYGLQKPSFHVKFTIRDEEKPIELQVGDFTNDDNVYVKTNRSNQITSVKRELIDKIAKGVAWLREKKIVNFTIDDPIRCTVEYSEDSQDSDRVQFTCQRLGTNWRLTYPVQENAKNAEVNAFLYELIDLKAEKFVGLTFDGESNELPEQTTGFNSPLIHISVELRNKKVATLQVGKSDSTGRFYARLQNQPEHIFLLKSEQIPKLKPKLDWLRAPEEQ